MFRFLAIAPLLLAACATTTAATPSADGLSFVGSDGAKHDLSVRPEGVKLRVFTFVSDHCPVQAAHDARLRTTFEKYRSKGVEILGVDSEDGASADRARDEVERHALPFVVLADPEGVLAERLGARYATYSVILDPAGVVRYRGAIDSDRTELHDDATRFLDRALDQLLQGQVAEPAETQALGCVLRRK